MYHKLIIAGYLGRDPEMRYLPDGTPVTNMSVAVNYGKDQTMWWKVTTWRKLAETCNDWLSKGSAVICDGTIRPDPETGAPSMWEDREGRMRASYEMTAHTVRFLNKKGSDAKQEKPDRKTDDEFDPFDPF